MPKPLTNFWDRFSLRARITALAVIMISGGLVLSGMGTQSMLSGVLHDQLDSQLTKATKTFAGIPAAQVLPQLSDSRLLLPNDYFTVYFDTDGNEAAAWGPSGAVRQNLPSNEMILSAANETGLGKPFTLTAGSNIGTWRMLALPSEDEGFVIVGLPMSSLYQTLLIYTNIYVAFGFLVLISAGSAIWMTVGSVLAPLRRAERQAWAVAEGDYSTRLHGESTQTEVGRLNLSLNRMTDDIESAFSRRAETIDHMRRFVADASHELRTPLVSVRGYAELYRMGALKDETQVAQAMERIEKEAIRMGGLVEDLLELARLDETRPLTLSQVNLIALAKDAALDASARDHSREITVVTPPIGIETTASTDETSTAKTVAPVPEPTPAKKETKSLRETMNLRRPGKRQKDKDKTVEDDTQQITTQPDDTRPISTIEPIVLAEENKLRQVFTNLIANALRFTPDGSPIEIVVGCTPGQKIAFFEIRDHGDGIPTQIKEKIFQRFWRADTSRTRETGGSGLGLAIVSAIIHAHKGSVSVHDTEGGGATFRVELPLKSSPGTQAAVRSAQ